MRMALGVFVLAALTVFSDPGEAMSVSKSQAIALAPRQCDFDSHDFQKWDARSVGANWEVRGRYPRRPGYLSQAMVTIPKNGNAPFNCEGIVVPGSAIDFITTRIPGSHKAP